MHTAVIKLDNQGDFNCQWSRLPRFRLQLVGVGEVTPLPSLSTPGRPANPDSGRDKEGLHGQGCGEWSHPTKSEQPGPLNIDESGARHLAEALKQLTPFQIESSTATQRAKGKWPG